VARGAIAERTLALEDLRLPKIAVLKRRLKPPQTQAIMIADAEAHALFPELEYRHRR
jgi:hypothetical protein